jgi:hypothetical protein
MDKRRRGYVRMKVEDFIDMMMAETKAAIKEMEA